MSVLDEELIKIANLFGGEEAVTVVKSLKKLGEATDEIITNDCGIRLNTVRKVLYKLYDHGLVSCTRVRDEKTGWFIFYWRLQPDQLDAFIRSRKKRALDKLKQRADFERNHSFFICKNDPDIRVTFEEAMETSFKCGKCGNQLDSSENAQLISGLEARIEKLEAELSR
ncbi:MAG TPA: transcription factor [Candidatus Dormibacteraeota bacterium]|nr:transcription factor [Candidatus Dormibacteraeota bacterium]